MSNELDRRSQRTRRGGAVALLVAGLVLGATTASIASAPSRMQGSQPAVQAAATGPAGAVRTLSLPPRSLVQPNGSQPLVTDIDTGCATTTSFSFATMPVHLPDGATLVGLRATIRRDGTDDLANVNLVRHLTTTDGANFTILLQSHSPTSDPAGFTEISGVGSFAIDNTNSHLVLEARTDNGAEVCGLEVDYTMPVGDYVVAVDPCSILDVREGEGGRGSNLGVRETIDVDGVSEDFSAVGGDASDCGIPDNATALEVSVLMHGATSNGGLQMWASDVDRPDARVAVFRAGDRDTFGTVVKLGADGAFKLRNVSNGFMAVEVVVVGYHVAG